MNTRDFFAKILPTQGIYVLTMLGGEKPIQRGIHTIDQLAATAEQFDEQGNLSVYHCCGSVAEIKKGMRREENMLMYRSIWADIDVGKDNDKNSYDTIEQAAAAVSTALKTIGMPKPMIVKSGMGLHLYWPMDEDLEKEEWHKLASALKVALAKAGLKQDPKVTADYCRILRPIGTHWRKDGKERKVVLLRDAGPFDADKIAEILNGFAGAPPSKSRFAVTNDLKQERVYPDSSAKKVAEKCAAVREVAESQGNVTEPQWRGVLGLVKHCIEGEALAHEWSEGHPDYDYDETQRKYESWSTPPATCGYFQAETQACTNCPHPANGIKSPIRLGYTGTAQNAPPPQPQQNMVVQPATPPSRPAGFRWSQVFMERLVPGADEDDPPRWRPFADTCFDVINRVREADGTWVVNIEAVTRNGTKRQFGIPSKLTANPREFVAELAAREVYMVGKKSDAQYDVTDYVQEYVRELQRHNLESRTYRSFGFHMDDDGLAFVVGDKRITAKGESEAICSDDIREDWHVSFGRAGTAQRWVDIVDDVYNHKGMEPYQFAILSAFAAPLVYIHGTMGWNGIPVALTGETSGGKTTTGLVGCSIYGNADLFTISADKETGATNQSLVNMMGSMHHLPFVLDEASNYSGQDLATLLYSFSMGRGKDRMTASGKPAKTGQGWKTIPIMTANVNINELLAMIPAAHKAEATQVRVFEINMDKVTGSQKYTRQELHNILKDDLLSTNYGEVGRVYLKTLIANHDKVKRMIAQEVRKDMPEELKDETDQDSSERFYYDLMADVMVAGRIANKLGLVGFDMDALRTWTAKHIKMLREERNNRKYTPEEHAAHIISTLHSNNTLVTRYYRDGRGKQKQEIPLREPKGELLARVAVEDKRVLVSAKAINDWCAQSGTQPSQLRRKLEANGVINSFLTKSMPRAYLGRGTNITGGQVRVWHFNYDKLVGDSGLSLVQATEVADEAANG